MSTTGGGHPEPRITSAPEPKVGPSAPSGAGSANVQYPAELHGDTLARHVTRSGDVGRHLLPDLAELTHQMCALTKGKYDPVCTHSPAEVLQRGIHEILRLRREVQELRTDREVAW